MFHAFLNPWRFLYFYSWRFLIDHRVVLGYTGSCSRDQIPVSLIGGFCKHKAAWTPLCLYITPQRERCACYRGVMDVNYRPPVPQNIHSCFVLIDANTSHMLQTFSASSWIGFCVPLSSDFNTKLSLAQPTAEFKVNTPLSVSLFKSSSSVNKWSWHGESVWRFRAAGFAWDWCCSRGGHMVTSGRAFMMNRCRWDACVSADNLRKYNTSPHLQAFLICTSAFV